MSKDRFERDLRRYARSTTIRLFLGGTLLVLVVGNLLVWLVYGSGALRTSLLCMLVFAIPAALAFGALALMDWYVRREFGD